MTGRLAADPYPHPAGRLAAQLFPWLYPHLRLLPAAEAKARP